jgi:predicted permease
MTEPGAPLPDPIFDRAPGDEVTDELRFHHDMYVRDLVARGHTPAAAERLARERLRSLDHAGDECRDLARQRHHAVRRHHYLVNLIQDVHFALRMLRRRPAFALLAIVTVALGVGAATAIYSVVDGVMLRPLPFNNPGQLVAVWITEQSFRHDATLSSWWDHIVVGTNDYTTVSAGARTLTDVALWGPDAQYLTVNGQTNEVFSIRATSTLLHTLRVQPVLGRGFLPGEDVLDGPRVAMISWEAWQSRWNGDSAMLGRSITLGTRQYTVVGVLPPGLRLDRTQPPAVVWLPALQDSSDIASKHNRSYHMLARLIPGYTMAQATVEASSLMHASAASWGDADHANGVAARVEQWQVDQTRDVRASLWILAAAVGLLLLIACANVATLMLGEAVRREPEIAARVSLGAGPSRVARQLITESLTIALLGALLGTAIGWAAMRLLVTLAPGKIPGLADVRLDLRVLAFTVACSIATGILFGLAPALMLMRRGTRAIVRVGQGQTLRSHGMIQHTVIAAEVALSLVLLAGCALLGHSLLRITEVNPGFRPDNLLVVGLDQRGAFWRDDDRQRRFFSAAMRDIAAIPGVMSVATASAAPFSGSGGSSSPVRVDTKTYVGNETEGNSQQRSISAGYFHTLGIPLLIGRAFDERDRDGSELTMIVSEAEARRDWPGQSPVGHRLFWQAQWRLIVGMVGDIKYNQLSRDAEPTVYVPFDQDVGANSLFVRVRNITPGLDSAIRRQVGPLDAAVSIDAIIPMTTAIGKSYAEERYRALLSSLFGVLAGVLAAVGIFGVISRTVARRMREAGIRLALGAPMPGLIGLMMRDGLISAGIGLGAGLVGALVVSHALKPYLFGVATMDPVALAAAIVLLGSATLVATIVPARRAARVDPAVVLRTE